MKLAIGNIVRVPLTLTLSNNGRNERHTIALTCKRLPEDELLRRAREIYRSEDDPEKQAPADVLFARVREFAHEIITGWGDQELILDDDNHPAPFSADALDMLLTIPGTGMAIFSAYQKEAGLKQKN